MNAGETRKRPHGLGRLHVIQRKDLRRLSCLVKQNRSLTVAQLIAQYSAEPRGNVSDLIVQGIRLGMGLRSRQPTYVPLLTKCHRQLRLRHR